MNDNDFEDIKGYEGLYKINRKGDILGVKYNKILKPNVSKIGYIQVGLSRNNQRKQYLLHRLLSIQYLDNPENKRCVDHIDRNKQNNCLGNLRWATDSENSSNISVNGSIYITRSNTFQASYFYEPRKRMNKTFKTKEECETWLEQIKIEYPR